MAEADAQQRRPEYPYREGRSHATIRAADGFARRWEATGRSVVCVVTWSESAVAWLRQATRFAAADPDLWVMAGPAARRAPRSA